MSVREAPGMPAGGQQRERERERGRTSRTSKYAPLGVYLRGRSDSRITLSAATITVILGAPLPSSARTPDWWHNRLHGGSHARSWLDAGWRVVDVARGSGAVTFVRAA